MAGDRWDGFSGLMGVAGLAVALWCSGAAADVVSDWATMSGGLSAKVVYWRDVDGTDDGNGAICVLDLTTGVETPILTEAVPGRPIVQWSGQGPYPCWSPDGTRIRFHNINNDWTVWVVNADGSNPKRIWDVDMTTHCITNWWDNDWVVILAGGASYPNNDIYKVRLDANNDVVQTDPVITFAPYGGSGRSFVTMSGDYVAWTDGSANQPTGGGHRSLVRKISTGEEHEVIARNDDACNIHLKQDGSGTCVFSHADHYTTEIKSFAVGENPGGTLLGTLPTLLGGQIDFLRWSQHPDYICHIDARAKALADQRAWIRKLQNDQDTGESLLLGTGIWGPDVWVDTGPPPAITVTSPDGGESWTAGSVQTVTWTSGGTVGNVKIELSTNGGSSWTALVASTSNDGTEPVTLPAVGSTQCLIRVSETDGSPSDVSDGVFSILYLDTDGDGMPDWWEDQYSLNKTDPSDAADDPDVDGLDNLEEYQAGTDPRDEDTDGDGILDGDDNDPLNPPSTLAGGCSPGGAALPLVIAISWLAARLRRREGTVG